MSDAEASLGVDAQTAMPSSCINDAVKVRLPCIRAYRGVAGMLSRRLMVSVILLDKKRGRRRDRDFGV